MRIRRGESDCTGCTLCAKVCPTQAATGERKAVHRIDEALCIKCGLCFESCRFDAIEITTGVVPAETVAAEMEA